MTKECAVRRHYAYACAHMRAHVCACVQGVWQSSVTFVILCHSSVTVLSSGGGCLCHPILLYSNIIYLINYVMLYCCIGIYRNIGLNCAK
jgi:hypothetical protein